MTLLDEIANLRRRLEQSIAETAAKDAEAQAQADAHARTHVLCDDLRRQPLLNKFSGGDCLYYDSGGGNRGLVVLAEQHTDGHLPIKVRCNDRKKSPREGDPYPHGALPVPVARVECHAHATTLADN